MGITCDIDRQGQGLAELRDTGLTTPPAGGDPTTSEQISHVISLGHFSRSPENVAIPTMWIQHFN